MSNSVILALLAAISAQTGVERMAPPERPVFRVSGEDDASSAPATQARNSAALDDNRAAETSLNDARISDICFVDDQYGWAVGDRGVIWHTRDGGRAWSLQQSGVDCHLHSVCFLNKNVGFAAGGSAMPYTHTGRGVLLATRDGGRTWSANSRLMLPVLNRIIFTDPRHGWALGYRSAMQHSGVFATDDGGRNWRPMFGSGESSWLTGDFIASGAGALAGRYAQAGTTSGGEIESFLINQAGLQNLRSLRLVPPLYGWLVGDGGIILLTGNAGAAWRESAGNFPAQIARHFDFSALAVRGPKAWIAGTPGSRIFFTPDAGATWSAFPTGIFTPISTIAFADDEHGWAAGALGTILATADGGRTWQRQRSGGSRTALLAIAAEAEGTPLELLAKLSGDEGYLAAVEVVARRDVEIRPDDGVPLEERLNQAAAEAGASYAHLAWQFPLRQSGLQLSEEQYRKTYLKTIRRKTGSQNGELNPKTDTPGETTASDSPNDRSTDKTQFGRIDMDALEEHIVGLLRMWRPDVVVTEKIVSNSPDRLGPLVGKAVLHAVDLAADPNAYPRQIDQQGLNPWRAKQVFAPSDPGARGSVEIAASQFAAGLGRSPADAAAEPRGLISERVVLAPTRLDYSPLTEHGLENRESGGMMAGLGLLPGGEARRELNSSPSDNAEALKHTSLKRRNAQAILDQALRNPGEQSNLAAKIGELVRDLDDDTATRMLYCLADEYHRSGRWTAAAEIFTLLTERYPRHPLTDRALLWLVRYQTSGEIACQQLFGQKAAPDRSSRPAADAANPEDRLARAAALGKQIERTRPDLFAEPAIKFPLASAWRNQGLTKQAEQFYLAQSRGPEHNAWSACAEGEIGLANEKGGQSKPVQRCWRAVSKPKLDGRLDDAIWRNIETVPLKSALNDDDQWPALAAIAYDDDFLYFAATCRRAPGVKYEPVRGPRPRDADLSASDRVDVLIDIDRDFATYYRLTIDYRGFTADSLWGDSAWNPTWYVAAELTDETWTVEAAIPLNELIPRRRCADVAADRASPADAETPGKTPDPPVKSRDAWAVGVQRTIPGVGFQSWSAPASTQVAPEGFGYLIFQ